MGGVNVLTDVMLLCAPIPQLWKLQMRRAAKLQLIGIFSVGIMFVTHSPDLSVIGTFADRALLAHSVTVISIYRIPKLQGLLLLDPAWDDVDSSIWSIAEISVAILCASAITFRPLFNWVFRIRHFSFKVRILDVAKSLRPDHTSTGSKPNKTGDVEMQPPRSLANYSKSRVVENGDRFYRIDDSASV